MRAILTRLNELVMAASFPAESAPDPVKDIILCMKKVVELENGVECKQFRGPGTLEHLLPIVTSPCLTSANMLSFKNFFIENCSIYTPFSSVVKVPDQRAIPSL